MEKILLIGLIVVLIVFFLKKLGPIGIAVAALGYMAWFYMPTEVDDGAPVDPAEIIDSARTEPVEINDSVLIEPVEIDNEVEIQKNIYFVNTGRLNVRVKPGVSGRIVDFFDKGQKIEVLETKGDWARITHYSDGEGTVSTGDVALWVYAIHLSTDRPAAARTESKTISIAEE